MNKTILRFGVFFGMLAVLFGALGAHSLEGSIPASAMKAFKTGVEYQMYHALLLLALGNMDSLDAKNKKWVFRFLVAGILCFSFSLYVLALAGLANLDLGLFGFLTPVGGLLLISGWLLLGYRLFKPIS